MASKNAELRVSTGTTFGGADQLIYMRSHINLVDGLLSAGKIVDSLLPSYLFGGMRFVDTIQPSSDETEDTTAEILSKLNTYISSAGGSRRGCFFINSGQSVTAGTITVSTGHTVYASGTEEQEGMFVAGQNFTLGVGDWLICTSDDGTVWSVVNNTYELATTSLPGLFSASDKTKLDGIATGANNYVHPTQAALSIDNSDIETVDQITVNTLGHVTALTKQTIRTATTSLSGVMSAADKTKLDGIATGANNYVHPSDGGAGFALTLGGIERIAAITVNTAGHITAVSKENIDAASESLPGVIEIATATEAKAGTDNTRAVTPAGGKAMIDLLAGLKAYASVATADTDIANNPSGKLALIYV